MTSFEWNIDNLFFSREDVSKTSQGNERKHCAVPKPPTLQKGELPLTQAFQSTPNSVQLSQIQPLQSCGSAQSFGAVGEKKRQPVGIVLPSQPSSLSARRKLFQPPGQQKNGCDSINPNSPASANGADDLDTNPSADSDKEDIFSDSPEGEPISGSIQPMRKQLRRYTAQTSDVLNTPAHLSVRGRASEEDGKSLLMLRSTAEIPEKFRSIFGFPYFNAVQSQVLDDVLYTDKAIVLCAPTGSGKTVAFELAIIRLLVRLESSVENNKIVYMAPTKALCGERFEDWRKKFSSFGVRCLELTGDTEMDEYFDMQNANLILTTPEKWDSMTRRWRDNISLVLMVRLFLIDEVHLLNDDTRGATMEAVISRMKTIVQSLQERKKEQQAGGREGSPDRRDPRPGIRFMAVSATVPNASDVADWLSTGENKAFTHKMDESFRPVRLRKVVIGYPTSENTSEFKFDLTLNYKLASVIQTYSEQKPTLVFCATRKSVQQGAGILAKEAKYLVSTCNKPHLQALANSLRDSKLRDLVLCGVGYHHAGLELSDRKTIESMFSRGDLPVLLATSTLAMGVNLPAHLVIIKSTQHYVMGMYQEYAESQILQMIGRAGRPQFDTSATAVIMTRAGTKSKYDSLLNGTQLIESSLHQNLVEHLNAEIVLGTITDYSVALEWLRSTFLYIRVMKNPKHYGIAAGLSREKVEQKLQEMCMKSVNSLASVRLVTLDDDLFALQPTASGRLMARYCVGFETMKNFHQIAGTESMQELLAVVCNSHEFRDIKLRTNEKKALNTLNKDKNRATIRFEMSGKIKSSEMKVNCLIQATLGSLTIQDFPLQQDVGKIFRAGGRVLRCLVEMLWQRGDFKALLNAVLLSKCFRAKMWENSKHVTRQLTGIGTTLSNALVNAGIVTFQKVEDTNPRNIELIVNRHPPFGNHVRDAVTRLPKYELCIDQCSKYNSMTADLNISVGIANSSTLNEKCTVEKRHTCVLLLGAADNSIVFKMKISDAQLLRDGTWSTKVKVNRAADSDEISVNLISQEWVGLDVRSTYTPFYTEARRPKAPTDGAVIAKSQATLNRPPLTSQPKLSANHSENVLESAYFGEAERVPCSHKCSDKELCAHDCCKAGVRRRKSKVDAWMQELQTKRSRRENSTPALVQSVRGTPGRNLQKYAYTPARMPACRAPARAPASSATAAPSKKSLPVSGYKMMDLQQWARGNYVGRDADLTQNRESGDCLVVEDFQNTTSRVPVDASSQQPSAQNFHDNWENFYDDCLPDLNGYSQPEFFHEDNRKTGAIEMNSQSEDSIEDFITESTPRRMKYQPVCITGQDDVVVPKQREKRKPLFRKLPIPRSYQHPANFQRDPAPILAPNTGGSYEKTKTPLAKSDLNDHGENTVSDWDDDSDMNFDLQDNIIDLDSDMELGDFEETSTDTMEEDRKCQNSALAFTTRKLDTSHNNSIIPQKSGPAVISRPYSRNKRPDFRPYSSFRPASDIIKEGSIVEKRNPDEFLDFSSDPFKYRETYSPNDKRSDVTHRQQAPPGGVLETMETGSDSDFEFPSSSHLKKSEQNPDYKKTIKSVVEESGRYGKAESEKMNSPDSAELSQELDRYEAMCQQLKAPSSTTTVVRSPIQENTTNNSQGTAGTVTKVATVAKEVAPTPEPEVTPNVGQFFSGLPYAQGNLSPEQTDEYTDIFAGIF